MAVLRGGHSFCTVDEKSKTPDGGATIMLLGTAFGALGITGASSVNIEASDLPFSVQIDSIVAVHRTATILVRRARQWRKLRVLEPVIS